MYVWVSIYTHPPIQPTDPPTNQFIHPHIQVSSGKMKTTGQAVWVVSGEVVASQRCRVYHTTVVFNKVRSSLSLSHTHIHTYIHAKQATGKALDKPAGSCECVAHLGWCSHQAALGFLFVNFLKLFPRVARPHFLTLTFTLTGTNTCIYTHSQDASCDDFCRVYPPNVFMVQRDGCPWDYAVSRQDQLKSFSKLKWPNGETPESMR